MRVILRYLKRLPNGKFQYRRVWPQDVRAAVADLPREKKKTFSSPNGTEDEAIKIALRLNNEFEALVARVRRGLEAEASAWRTDEKVRRWYEENRESLQEVVVSSEITDDYGYPAEEEVTAGELLADSILDQAAKREGVGTDGHPERLTREEAVKVSALYSGKLPEPRLTVRDAYELYIEKHFGGRSNKATDAAFEQFHEFAGNVPLTSVSRRTVHDWMDWLMTTRSQAAATIKRRIGTMKAIFNFVADRELYVGKNPFERMKAPSVAKAPEERLPFHRSHLEAIDAYLKASNRVRPKTRHLVALLKFTGCRPSEIGGLKVEDLSLGGPIPYALVRWTAERRLKTFQSQRRVPLIGEAMQAAEALADARKSGWLFPSLAPKDGSGNENPALSTRVNKVIRAAGVPKSRALVAYSFRHTMIEALDQVPSISFKVRERTVGRGNTDQYGAKEQPLEVTLEAMSAAIPLLGRVDDVMYEPWMLEINPRADQ
jgi:integrase